MRALLLCFAACSSLDAAPRSTPPHCTGTPVLKCETFGYQAGVITCTPEGDLDITRCVPVTTPTFLAPSSDPARCGNGKIDSVTQRVCAPCTPQSAPCPCSNSTRKIEQCDGASLDGATCKSLGYLGGTLACTKTCTLDSSRCTTLAVDHPWKASLRLGGLAGLTGGTDVPGAIGAKPGAVAAAWAIQDRTTRSRFDIAFAWSDPSLSVLRTSKPFDGGWAGHMRLAGNDAGWLLAISTYGDNPGPLGPAVRVVPISNNGHVGAPGARVERQGVVFLVRGARGEPSLVGSLHGLMIGTQAHWRLDGWLVDERGEPMTKPFEIGTPTPTYSVMGATAAYLGGGKFVTARGSTRDPAIELAIVDLKGNVQILPVSHPDLHGQPVGIVAGKDRIDVVFHRSGTVAAYTFAFTPDGKLLEAPRQVSQDAPIGLVRPATAPTLVTMTATNIGLQPINGRGRTIAAPVYVPMIADADDAAYALAITPQAASIVRLR